MNAYDACWSVKMFQDAVSKLRESMASMEGHSHAHSRDDHDDHDDHEEAMEKFDDTLPVVLSVVALVTLILHWSALGTGRKA